MNSEEGVIKIDDYTVIKKIGAGPDGSSYLVRNNQNGQIFVIKVFKQGVSPWIEKGYVNMTWLNHINILKCMHLANKFEGTLTF